MKTNLTNEMAEALARLEAIEKRLAAVVTTDPVQVRVLEEIRLTIAAANRK